MPELVIICISNTNVNPDLDKCCYKKYDIVEVREDGLTNYPHCECLDSMLVVKIVGMEVSELLYLVEPEVNETGEMVLRRKYYFDYDTVLGAEVMEEIRNSETMDIVSITLDQISEKVIL